MKIHEVAILIAAVLIIVASNIVIVFRTQMDITNQRPSQSVTSIPEPADYDFDWGSCDIDAFDIIRNGTIYDEGEVIKQNGQVVDISGGDPKPRKSYSIKDVEYKTQPLGVLLHSHDATYYHALIQFGSRFQYIAENCKNSDVTWVIRASPTQKKILALLNQPPVLNLTVYKPSKRLSSQLILLPPAPYRAQDLISFRMALMRRALPPPSLPFIDKPPRAQTTVFVRRVRRRAIKNEADVLRPIREAFPHRLVYFHEREDVPFAATIATFQAAAQVLGGHGAGLANIIFCRPGARVFEIRRNGTPSEFASELAPAFRLRLHRYVDPKLLSHRPELHYSNYSVHAPAWRAFVRRAAGLPPEPAPAPDRPPPGKKRKRKPASAGKSKGSSGRPGPDAEPAPPDGAGTEVFEAGEGGLAIKGFWG
jgi:hypothetical protein